MGLVAFIMAYALFAFIFYILQVIAYWKILQKPGKKDEIHHSNLQWLCTVPADMGCAVFLGGTGTGGRRRYFKFLRRNRGVIGSLALLGTALMNVVALYKLACAYGHGIGFTIGLFFLNPLFMLILGFGDSEYMGPQE